MVRTMSAFVSFFLKAKNGTTMKDKHPEKTKAQENYPGIANNIADKDKVTPALVDERTKTINNNPRNHKD